MRQVRSLDLRGDSTNIHISILTVRISTLVFVANNPLHPKMNSHALYNIKDLQNVVVWLVQLDQDWQHSIYNCTAKMSSQIYYKDNIEMFYFLNKK